MNFDSIIAQPYNRSTALPSGIVLELFALVAMMSIASVDRYGRIKIPKSLLEQFGTRVFLIKRVEQGILLIPVKYRKLSELIDSVEIDVEPEAFADYDELKRVLVEDRG